MNYIRKINIKALRDYILDEDITDSDTILLHHTDFDNIVLEYRNIYMEGITLPYLLLGVLIKEDENNSVSANRIKVIKDDTMSIRTIIEEKPNFEEPIYRCGWCGNVVEYDGREFSPEMRMYKISVIENYSSFITQKLTNGYCCKDKW